jgi:excisionase family DNA binding protein
MSSVRNPNQIPMPPAGKLMLSVMEAAAVSGLGRSTVYRLVVGKAIPSKRIGKRWLIRRSDLEKFLSPDHPGL